MTDYYEVNSKNIDKIGYLNKAISEGKSFIYCGPKYLYKYRPFDEYTFDMLENKYIFLCPAEKEDDETECITTINIRDYYELKTNNLKRLCVEQIIEMIKPYCSQDVFEDVKQKILGCVLNDGTIRRNFLLDLTPEIEQLVPCDVAIKLVNWLSNIPEKLDNALINSKIETLISMALSARQETGICSLSEEPGLSYMWEKYAADCSGYCIEYEMYGYEYFKDVFPVIYEDNRETNVVISIVNDFIGQMIISFSNKEIKADISKYLRLFLTKLKKWEYQNEWRVLGDANGKPAAPKISKIIVGKNSSIENKENMKRYCEKNDIIYEELRDD